MDEHDIRAFDAGHHDEIRAKRYDSPFWIRRFAHRAIYERSACEVGPAQAVLGAGCGEGVLAGLMAGRGASVVAVDISLANVTAARRHTGADSGRRPPVRYVVGDLDWRVWVALGRRRARGVVRRLRLGTHIVARPVRSP